MKEVLDSLFWGINKYSAIPFAVEFWDDGVRRYGEGVERFKLILMSEGAARRVFDGGTLGFGEEFMRGNIRVEGALQDLIRIGDLLREVWANVSVKDKMRIIFHRLAAAGTQKNARKNVNYHYDIGNDFYALWLDRTMTYSGAYFKEGGEDLEAAQINKYEHLCRKLQLKAGESLVDVGCGWGGMMFYAAKNYGVKCGGYTLSRNQYRYILQMIKKEGLEKRVKIYLQDYREVAGSFDKFVSIGMFEHVGKKFYPDFFGIVRKILKPGGIGILQTIGAREGKETDPWIERYIFPGGFIPTLEMICQGMSRCGLNFYDIEDLRMHYALTLDRWIDNFEENSEWIKRVIFYQLKDRQMADNFMRMWRLYLNGSAVSFKTGGNKLYQLLFSNGMNNDLPLTRDYIYN